MNDVSSHLGKCEDASPSKPPVQRFLRRSIRVGRRGLAVADAGRPFATRREKEHSMKYLLAELALVLALSRLSPGAALERESRELTVKDRGAISISYRKDMLGCFIVKNVELGFKDKVTMSFDYAPSAGEGGSPCSCPLGESSMRTMIFVVFPYLSSASEKQNVTAFGSPTVGKLVNLSATNPFLPAGGPASGEADALPKRETLSFPPANIGGKLARRYRVDWQCSFPAFKKRG
jgi:hypothetical protein